MSPSCEPDQISDEVLFKKVKTATAFITHTLKNYKLFKENEQLFCRVYSICDQCYQIRALWDDKRIDHFNKVHNINLCQDCFADVPEEDKSRFVDVKYVRENQGGLFCRQADQTDESV